MNGVRALLPLKDLVAAKTRLAGVLAPSERRALMQAMAEDVLAVLVAHPAVTAVTLVSDDPGAALLANSFGVAHCPEQALGCSGLNAVLAAACNRDRAASERERASSGGERASSDRKRVPSDRQLVLHADIPCLTAADIDAALAAQHAGGGLLVGPDRWGRGTNLLLFDAGRPPRFAFGVDSCARHLAWAREAGVPARVLQRSGIARDVDQPADLQELLAGRGPAPGRATRAVLERPALAARLSLALADMPQAPGSIETPSGTNNEYESLP